MKIVEGGPITDIAKKSLDALFKSLDTFMNTMAKDTKFEKYGFSPKDSKEVDEDGMKGKYYLFESGYGQVVEVTLFDIQDNEDSYMIRIESDDHPKFERGPIKRDDIEKYVLDYFDKYDMGSLEEGVDVYESTKIAVKLRRVVGTTEDTIELLSVCKDDTCKATDAMEAIDTLLNDSYVDNITEEPMCLEIEDTGDEIEVNEIEEVEVSNPYLTLAYKAFEVKNNIRTVMFAYNDPGNNSGNLFSSTYELENQIDVFSKLSVQRYGEVPNFLNHEYTPVDTTCKYDYEKASSTVSCLLHEYLSEVECYTVNIDNEQDIAQISTMTSYLNNLLYGIDTGVLI